MVNPLGLAYSDPDPATPSADTRNWTSCEAGRSYPTHRPRRRGRGWSPGCSSPHRSPRSGEPGPAGSPTPTAAAGCPRRDVVRVPGTGDRDVRILLLEPGNQRLVQLPKTLAVIEGQLDRLAAEGGAHSPAAPPRPTTPGRTSRERTRKAPPPTPRWRNSPPRPPWPGEARRRTGSDDSSFLLQPRTEAGLVGGRTALARPQQGPSHGRRISDSDHARCARGRPCQGSDLTVEHHRRQRCPKCELALEAFPGGGILSLVSESAGSAHRT